MFTWQRFSQHSTVLPSPTLFTLSLKSFCNMGIWTKPGLLEVTWRKVTVWLCWGVGGNPCGCAGQEKPKQPTCRLHKPELRGKTTDSKCTTRLEGQGYTKPEKTLLVIIFSIRVQLGMHWYKGWQELRRGYVHLDKMEVCKRPTKTHGRLKSNTCNTSWDLTHFTNIFLFHAALSLLKEPSQRLKPDIMNITTTIYLNNGSIPKTPFQDRGPIVLTLHKHIRLSSCAEEIVIYPDKVDKQHKGKMSTTKKKPPARDFCCFVLIYFP